MKQIICDRCGDRVEQKRNHLYGRLCDLRFYDDPHPWLAGYSAPVALGFEVLNGAVSVDLCDSCLSSVVLSPRRHDNPLVPR